MMLVDSLLCFFCTLSVSISLRYYLDSTPGTKKDPDMPAVMKILTLIIVFFTGFIFVSNNVITITSFFCYIIGYLTGSNFYDFVLFLVGMYVKKISQLDKQK